MNRLFRRFPVFLIFTFLSVYCVAAQEDPNPDSPVPVLLAQEQSAQVLAVDSRKWNGVLPKTGQSVFQPSRQTALTLFVTNLELMETEGANALRVYLYQKSGKTFELQNIELSRANKRVYALKVGLYDRDGFRGQPVADGESLIYVTWRGLVSNAQKIYLGSTGGEIKVPDYLKAPSFKAETDAPEAVGYRWSGDRARFFEQATFGSTTETDNRLRRIGLRVWLNEQFNAPYPSTPVPDIPLMPTNIPTSCSAAQNPTCFRERYTMTPLQQWFFKEAFYGDAQLRHRVAWALSQIWVTSGVSIQQSRHMFEYQKVLANNAFGNYRSLMKDMTLNPAMGDYLDMVRSTKANPNENYPREILQLFTVGTFLLNPDGTIQRDAQNNPIPSYTQETVNNFTKVFTGWSYCQNPASCPNVSSGILNYIDPMTLTPANHDTTSKTLFNYPNAPSATIPACTTCNTPEETANYAESSLSAALDNIFYHPNTAPFVSRLLIQHLVTSDPSPAYVQRVADVFAANRANPLQMKEVVKAILLDPEARGNFKSAPRYGKLREPVQVVTNLARNFPAKSWDGNSLSDGGLSNSMIKMGQNPFYSPTVFNYYSPDFIVPGTTLNAPEFQLMNTTTAISRTNFLYTLIFEGVTPNASDSLRGTSLDLSEAQAFTEADATGNQLLDYLNTKMMHGVLTPEHRSAVLTAVLAIPATNPNLRTKTAIYLLASSSQYQVQR